MNTRIVLPWEKVRDAAVLAARGRMSRGGYFPEHVLVMGDQRSIPGAVLYATALCRLYGYTDAAMPQVYRAPAGEALVRTVCPEKLWDGTLELFSMDGDDLRAEGPLETVLGLATSEALEIRFGDDHERFTDLVGRTVLFPSQEDADEVESGFISAGSVRDPGVVFSYPWEVLS